MSKLADVKTQSSHGMFHFMMASPLSPHL